MMNSAPAVTSKYVLIHMCWLLFVCISNILSHCDVGGQNHVGIVAQLYPTVCYTLDYSSPSSSVHEISQARILDWVAIFLLQGIFPIQGLNLCLLCLLHCRQILHLYTCLIFKWDLNSGEGNGNPVQYSCLENSMDRGA